MPTRIAQFDGVLARLQVEGLEVFNLSCIRAVDVDHRILSLRLDLHLAGVGRLRVVCISRRTVPAVPRRTIPAGPVIGRSVVVARTIISAEADEHSRLGRRGRYNGY